MTSKGIGIKQTVIVKEEQLSLPLNVIQNTLDLRVLEQSKLIEYRNNSLIDQKKNKHRYSDVLIAASETIHPRAWRLITFLVGHIDLYPLSALKYIDDNGDFFDRFLNNKDSFARHDREFTITANQYADKFCKDNRGYAGKMLKEDLEALKSSEMVLSQEYFYEAAAKSEDSWQCIERSIQFTQLQVKGKSRTQTIADLDKCDRIVSCSITITNMLALMLLFQLKKFTLVEHDQVFGFNVVTKKVFEIGYCLLSSEKAKLKAKKSNQLASVTKRLDVERWRKMLGCKTSQVTRIKGHLDNVVAAINENCLMHCEAFYCESTKKGKEYQHIDVIFSENPSHVRHVIASKPKKRLMDKATHTPPKKPVKPKLKRKPKDFAKQIEWAKYNLKVLIKYKKELELCGRDLVKADRLRVEEYKAVISQI